MIKIKDLNKHFAKHKVLNEINLQFNAGECVALIGPNGSGKTTLGLALLRLTEVLRLLGGVRGEETGVVGALAHRARDEALLRKLDLAATRQRLGVLLQLDPEDVGELVGANESGS